MTMLRVSTSGLCPADVVSTGRRALGGAWPNPPTARTRTAAMTMLPVLFISLLPGRDSRARASAVGGHGLRVRLCGVVEIFPGPVRDDLAVPGHASDGDLPAGGLPGILTKDLQRDRKVLADPLVHGPSRGVVGDEELSLGGQAEKEGVLAVEEETDRFGPRRLVEEGDGGLEQER